MQAGEYKHLGIEQREDGITVVRLDRPEKKNAINDDLIASLDRFFGDPPAGTRVVVLHGAGDAFSAGLDLAEHKERDAFGVMQHSRLWHRAFDKLENGGLPVVAALHGAVIGGGMEIAMACHVRVAEQSTFFQLPEGRRGIFVGGGASVRVGRIIGADRLREMMLTGRRRNAEDGLALGLAHYLVEDGRGLQAALDLAKTIAGNAPISNHLMLTALGHIGNMATGDGLYTESMAAALAQTSDHAREGMKAFLEKRAEKFDPKK